MSAVLDRVFPADQLDPELLERPVFARPTDQTIRGAHHDLWTDGAGA